MRTVIITLLLYVVQLCIRTASIVISFPAQECRRLDGDGDDDNSYGLWRIYRHNAGRRVLTLRAV